MPAARVAFAFLAVLVAAYVALRGVAVSALHAAPSWGLELAVAFVALDLAVGLVVLLSARRALAKPLPKLHAARAEVSVLVAAYQESRDIVRTLRSLLAQTGVELEVLVADDGSTDGTSERARSVDDPRVRVLTLAHHGKGAALNAALARARYAIVVTVDADTELEAGALATLVAPFADASVEAACGCVVVRNPGRWLTRFQYAEYAKNAFIRAGWSGLDALEQVPGAFAAFRTTALRAVRGFPEDSLTDDYEVAYRLYDRAAREGRRVRIPTVLEARAYTEAPVTLRGLVRQRTRWFAGFLSTLWRFRHLIGQPAAGTFGVVKLPIKVLDAFLPLVGLASLCALLYGVVRGTAELSALSALLLAVRWGFDAVFYANVLAAFERTAPSGARPVPRGWAWTCAMAEALSYAWLKQAAVLRAYDLALSRVRSWEPERAARSSDAPL